jgi:hypothetical protein
MKLVVHTYSPTFYWLSPDKTEHVHAARRFETSDGCHRNCHRNESELYSAKYLYFSLDALRNLSRYHTLARSFRHNLYYNLLNLSWYNHGSATSKTLYILSPESL